AGTVPSIALGEADAFVPDGVDVGRLDQTARYAAAVEADVIVAEVVGDNKDDIRLALAGRRPFRPRLPDHVAWRAYHDPSAFGRDMGRRLAPRGRDHRQACGDPRRHHSKTAF